MGHTHTFRVSSCSPESPAGDPWQLNHKRGVCKVEKYLVRKVKDIEILQQQKLI